MGLFRRKKPTKEDEGWKYYKMALDEKGCNTRLELEYTQKAIELGERHAMCHLASYYLDHCPTDKEKVREATQLMEQAESMGALLECRRIGYAYALQGLYDKAFPRYLKGAEEGDSFCQFCTGLYYKNGQGVEQDYAKAIYWYEKAVENKEVLAFNNLGLMYKDGLGVEKDNAKALELLKMGSELGNHTPSGNLAFDYYKGEDPCPQDYEKARHYAELGLSQSKGKNKNCRYVLAMLECDGLAGIPCNPCSAYDKVQQLAREEYKPALDGGVGYCLIKRSDWVKARRQEARNMMADRPEEAIAILQELRDLGFWQVEKDIEAYENMKARERALEQDDMYKKALEANDVNAIRQAAEHGSPLACADMLDRYMKDLEQSGGKPGWEREIGRYFRYCNTCTEILGEQRFTDIRERLSQWVLEHCQELLDMEDAWSAYMLLSQLDQHSSADLMRLRVKAARALDDPELLMRSLKALSLCQDAGEDERREADSELTTLKMKNG